MPAQSQLARYVKGIKPSTDSACLSLHWLPFQFVLRKRVQRNRKRVKAGRAKKRSKVTWQSILGYLPVYPWINCEVSKDTFSGQFWRPGAGVCITDVGCSMWFLGQRLIPSCKNSKNSMGRNKPNPKVNGLNPCFSGTYSRIKAAATYSPAGRKS